MKRLKFIQSAISLLLFSLLILPTPVLASNHTITFDEELNYTVAQACDWLDSSEMTSLSLFCLGTAGKSASSELFNSYLNEVTSSPISRDALKISSEILGFTFSGYYASQINQCDLLQELYQCNQPNNTMCCVYSILALESNSYPDQTNGNFSLDSLVNSLLSYQNEDGGFRMGKGISSSQIQYTAMSLTALSMVEQTNEVSQSIQKALSYLQKAENEDHEYEMNGENSSILAAEVLCAYCSLQSQGIPIDFSEDEKNEDLNILLRYLQNDGGFSDTLNGESSAEATGQAILAITAAQYNRNPYRMVNELIPISVDDSNNSDEIVSENVFTNTEINISVPVFQFFYFLLFAVILLYLIISKFSFSDYRRMRHIKQSFKKLQKDMLKINK